MRGKWTLAVSSLAVALACGPAFSAQLVTLEGKVSVNTGDGFREGKLGIDLKAGDQIFVGDKSNASIYYAESKCLVKFAPTSISVILASAPCKKGEKVVSIGSAVIKPAADLVDPNAQASECPDGTVPAESAEALPPAGAVASDDEDKEAALTSASDVTIVPTADVIDPNAQASEEPPIDPCAQAFAPAFAPALLAIPAAGAAAGIVVVADDNEPVSP